MRVLGTEEEEHEAEEDSDAAAVSSAAHIDWLLVLATRLAHLRMKIQAPVIHQQLLTGSGRTGLGVPVKALTAWNAFYVHVAHSIADQRADERAQPVAAVPYANAQRLLLPLVESTDKEDESGGHECLGRAEEGTERGHASKVTRSGHGHEQAAPDDNHHAHSLGDG